MSSIDFAKKPYNLPCAEKLTAAFFSLRVQNPDF